MKMIPFVRFAFAAVLLAGLSMSSVYGGGKPKALKPRAPFVPQYNEITGVDATGQTVTYALMNSKEKVVKTLKVNERTEIEVDGQPAKFADLKAGMQVDATMGMDADIAARLSAKAAPETPTPAPGAHPGKHAGRR